MTQDERLIAMQDWLTQSSKITLVEICQRFDISRDSARRDLVKLTQLPGVQRIRGGAISAPVMSGPIAYSQKEISQDKIEIARTAAQLIEENDALLLDSGTTLTALANQISLPVTVVTNAVDCLGVLSLNPEVELHFLGGQFNQFHRAMLGTEALEQLKQYHFSKAFIGVCALSKLGVSTTSSEEAAMKRAMLDRAQQVICLCDSSKFDKQQMFKVCDFDCIDILVTNQRPPKTIQQLLDLNDIHLIVTQPDSEI